MTNSKHENIHMFCIKHFVAVFHHPNSREGIKPVIILKLYRQA